MYLVRELTLWWPTLIANSNTCRCPGTFVSDIPLCEFSSDTTSAPATLLTLTTLTAKGVQASHMSPIGHQEKTRRHSSERSSHPRYRGRTHGQVKSTVTPLRSPWGWTPPPSPWAAGICASSEKQGTRFYSWVHCLIRGPWEPLATWDRVCLSRFSFSVTHIPSAVTAPAVRSPQIGGAIPGRRGSHSLHPESQIMLKTFCFEKKWSSYWNSYLIRRFT